LYVLHIALGFSPPLTCSIDAHTQFPLTSGLHFANPIPVEASIPKAEMDVIIAEAIKQADAAGMTGSDNTPFILTKIKELTSGKSLMANRVLIASNVRRGTIVARELAVLESQSEE
jgi:pseudouridine-5'-phosphate glycosidase/pseudouridine kinase